MREPKPLQNDPTLPFSINIVGQSPHVFAYRFWSQMPANQDWAIVAEGHTADDIPDHHQIQPLPDGARVAYWVGIGGKKTSVYRVVVTFSQQERIVPGGLEIIAGKTSAKGGAAAERMSILV